MGTSRSVTAGLTGFGRVSKVNVEGRTKAMVWVLVSTGAVISIFSGGVSLLINGSRHRDIIAKNVVGKDSKSGILIIIGEHCFHNNDGRILSNFKVLEGFFDRVGGLFDTTFKIPAIANPC